MIIRRTAASHQLITQPDHAALAEQIMRQWQHGDLSDSPNRSSILRAVEQHDCGWADADRTLVLDPATGRILDFMELSDALKRETSMRGIEELVTDPYAAALVAQHRLHVYRRYADQPEWQTFFADVTTLRDESIGAAGEALETLLRDYVFVRAGDLASLAFCNNWPEVDASECGYAMRLDGTCLAIRPDPFAGRTIDIEIRAREIAPQTFASPEDARSALRAAPVVILRGRVRGES